MKDLIYVSVVHAHYLLAPLATALSQQLAADRCRARLLWCTSNFLDRS